VTPGIELPHLTRWRRGREDLQPVARLALIPLVAAILGGAGGLAYSLTRPAPYESRSQVVVSPATGFLDPADVNSFTAISNTVQDLALTQRVLSDAAARLGDAGLRGRTPEWLGARLRLSGTTPLITITATAGSQTSASAISKAETDALVNEIGATSNVTAPTPEPRRLTPTKAASTAAATGIVLQVFAEGEPLGRARARTSHNVLVGISVGLVLGCLGVSQLLARESRRRPA
jgi:capsular polysaccharide biosynthesis protein